MKPIVRPIQAMLLVVLLNQACKPPPPTPVLKRADGSIVESPAPPDASTEEITRRLADAIRAERQRGADEAAIAAENDLIERYPNTEAAAEIYVRRAEAATESGATAQAIEFYERLLVYRPQYANIDEVRRRYAELLLEVDRSNDAAKMLESLYAEERSQTPELGLLWAEALARSGKGVQSIEILARLHGESAYRATVEKRVAKIVDALDYDSLQVAWEQSNRPDWRFIAPAIGFKLARMHFEARAYDQSRQVVDDYLARYGSGPYGEDAREFAERLEALAQVDASKVGVLMPLSGRFKPFGERSLEAIKIALGSDSDVELIVRDTMSDPDTTVRELKNMVLEHHVIAVIGPLVSRVALAAAQTAEELNVPLLSLSHRAGLPEVGPWVFRTSLTVEAQARGLAKVAFEELGFQNYALMWPKTTYGIAFATAFWKEVERRGGAIRAAESYEPDQTTFRDNVRRMVGRYYIGSRPEYRSGLAEIRARGLPSHRRRSAVEKLQKNVPPIVDFDAVVIPDTGRNIGLIAPALAVEDIVMTQDPQMLDKIRKATGREDIHPVTLMGGSTWNHPQTPNSCDRYCEEAVFVDAYYPDNPDVNVRDFVAAFQERVGAGPVLSDAQAFDTALLLKEIIRDQRPNNRDELRSTLVEMPVWQGVTGTWKFGEDGEAIKELFVLTINNRTIELWERPAPEG